MLDTKTSCMQPSASESETEPEWMERPEPLFTCSKVTSSRCSRNLDGILMRHNHNQGGCTRVQYECLSTNTGQNYLLTSVWQCPSTCLCWPWSPLCCTLWFPPEELKLAVDCSFLACLSLPSLALTRLSPENKTWRRSLGISDWLNDSHLQNNVAPTFLLQLLDVSATKTNQLPCRQAKSD